MTLCFLKVGWPASISFSLNGFSSSRTSDAENAYQELGLVNDRVQFWSSALAERMSDIDKFKVSGGIHFDTFGCLFAGACDWRLGGPRTEVVSGNVRWLLATVVVEKRWVNYES